MRWYQVFSYWLLAAWYLGLDVFVLMVLGAVATVLGQLYIIRKSKGQVRWSFVWFRILTHIIPLFYISQETDLRQSGTLIALYLVSLRLQGLNPFMVYRDIFNEPPNMSIREYLQRRFI